jgi:HAD superfamily 5'-nucleotidase-like hydrolase
MTAVRAIGFDLDHTLAHYDPVPVEQLGFDLTKKKLVEGKGYPREILDLQYDPQWVIRGLVVDRKRGNVLKMDYFNYVSRAYHGLTPLRSDERRRAYRSDRIRLGHENYVSVDTLFHLPRCTSTSASSTSSRSAAASRSTTRSSTRTCAR